MKFFIIFFNFIPVKNSTEPPVEKTTSNPPPKSSDQSELEKVKLANESLKSQLETKTKIKISFQKII